MQKKKVIFVADFFEEDGHIGGAELHDSVVVDYFLKKNILHEKVKSHKITEEYIFQNRDKVWFISNFYNLSFKNMVSLYSNCKYIIYEHDYKYHKNRNPIQDPQFVSRKSDLINLNFYKKAHKIICLCEFHRKIFDDNLRFNNIVNINCSMWSEKQLQVFEKLLFQNTEDKKRGIYAIMSSNMLNKKQQLSTQFCKKMGIEYEIIPRLEYVKFIQELSKYDGIVFATGHPEPTPRLAIEAKMLNINFLSQKSLIGVAHEDYFNLTGQEMINKVRNLREEALKKIYGWISEI